MNYKTVFLFGIMVAAALSACMMPTEIQAEGEGSSTPGTQPKEPAPAPVDDTNLTPYLDAPAGGAQAPSSLKGSPSQYSGSVAWTTDNDALEAGSTFTDGTAYTATVTLTAAKGYTFTGAGEFSHDAAGCTVEKSDTSGGSITVTIIFPAYTLYNGSFSGNPETGGGGTAS